MWPRLARRGGRPASAQRRTHTIENAPQARIKLLGDVIIASARPVLRPRRSAQSDHLGHLPFVEPVCRPRRRVCQCPSPASCSGFGPSAPPVVFISSWRPAAPPSLVLCLSHPRPGARPRPFPWASFQPPSQSAPARRPTVPVPGAYLIRLSRQNARTTRVLCSDELPHTSPPPEQRPTRPPSPPRPPDRPSG